MDSLQGECMSHPFVAFSGQPLNSNWQSAIADTLSIQFPAVPVFISPDPGCTRLPGPFDTPHLDDVPLHIRALGPVQVFRGAHLLTSSDWTYSRPQELFFYLLFHSPRTKEQIGLALWPDASPAKLRSNFRVALHAL